MTLQPIGNFLSSSMIWPNRIGNHASRILASRASSPTISSPKEHKAACALCQAGAFGRLKFFLAPLTQYGRETGDRRWWVVSNSALLLLLVVGSPLPHAVDAACWAGHQVRDSGTGIIAGRGRADGLFESEIGRSLGEEREGRGGSTTIRRRRGYSRHRGLSYDTKTAEAS